MIIINRFYYYHPDWVCRHPGSSPSTGFNTIWSATKMWTANQPVTIPIQSHFLFLSQGPVFESVKRAVLVSNVLVQLFDLVEVLVIRLEPLSMLPPFFSAILITSLNRTNDHPFFKRHHISASWKIVEFLCLSHTSILLMVFPCNTNRRISWFSNQSVYVNRRREHPRFRHWKTVCLLCLIDSLSSPVTPPSSSLGNSLCTSIFRHDHTWYRVS